MLTLFVNKMYEFGPIFPKRKGGRVKVQLRFEFQKGCG
jgi:hypothetical protein